jgi:hypothetical protein
MLDAGFWISRPAELNREDAKSAKEAQSGSR